MNSIHRFFAIPMIALGAMSMSATAHEFWLEPDNFSPKPNTNVAISILIGQNFKGNSYPYIRGEYKRFVTIDKRGERPVKGIDGDDPAVTMKFPQAGLAIMAHYSTAEPLTFETWESFENYLALEGLQHIGPLHRQLGKSLTNIKEIYTRCAKLLLNVGGEGGEDRATGMPLELVAEGNPYQLAAGEMLPVRLLFNGKPIEGVQITAFSRAEPANRQHVRTDAEGRARIALPVAGPWLLNAVHMLAPGPRDKADWTSLWASMTFSRP